MDKKWFVYYTFYDPEYPNGFRRQIRGGINRFKSFRLRKEAAEELMKHEMAELLEGFNPFKRKLIVPADSEVTPDTPFIQALQIAFKKVKGVKGTLVDIQSVIKGTAEAAEKLGIDQMQVKNVSRKYFKMIFEQCKVNLRFSANRQNVYRKWLKKLYDELIEMEAVEVNPLVFIRKEKVTKKERVLATYEQRTMINNYLRTNHYYLWRLMEIFFTSDARQTELYRVQKKHVNLKDQSCLYLIKKGQEERWVSRPIIDAALFLWEEIINECKSNEDFLFSNNMRPGVEQKDSEQFGRAWRRHVNGTLKTKRKENSRKKHSPIQKLNIKVKLNSLRHQSITEMMDRLDKHYNPVKDVSDLTGHKSGKMIAKVYDLNFDVRKNDKVKKWGRLF
jgi:integrase